MNTPFTRLWPCGLLRGRPDEIIGELANPYLLRWYLVPHNRWLNVYLHKFVRSDDPHLHDHPWAWFASLVVAGSYVEVTPVGLGSRRQASVALHAGTHRHRVILPLNTDGHEIPCWTVMITGPHRRQWGFWCGEQFIAWQSFHGCEGGRR